MKHPYTWDLFCQVIDNHGDLGVAVRLAQQLTDLQQCVRLWVDDPSGLSWMAPRLAVRDPSTNLQVWHWQDASDPELLRTMPPAQIWVEMFGCELPLAFVEHGVRERNRVGAPPPVWLNLEYLSAEDYVARSHRLPSPIFSGPASGWKKWFFYPGFTPETGGLLQSHARPATGSAPQTTGAPSDPAAASPIIATLFCYEPPGLCTWLQTMARAPNALPIHWRVMPGRPTAALTAALTAMGGLPANMSRTALPYMPQPTFDEELARADLNFVRGEDSLVSALRAGKPFVWHIYPQDDLAHHDKLHAFLDWLQAPASLVQMHLSWNGLANVAPPILDASTLAEWRACALKAQARIGAMPDLTQQLLSFVTQHMPAGG